MFFLSYLISFAIGYLMGSIPFGYIIGKAHGLDLTKEGSGSTGTTNALRLIGKKAAFLVLLGDFLKGLLAPFLAFWALIFLKIPGVYSVALIYVIACFGALIGHVKSCWIGFKGGKAVAAGVGTLYALDWRVGLITTIIWTTVVFISRYSSLGALVAVPLSPIIMFIFKKYFSPTLSSFNLSLYIGYCILGAIYIVYKHKANIGRLKNGTEPKIGQSK